MRALALFLASLCVIASANPNYANPGSSDLNSGACSAVPAGSPYIESPITIQDTVCTSYSNFQISLPDVANALPQEDGTRGSFVVSYPGATLQINGNSYTSKILTFRAKSENVLPNGRSDLEMQIEMENDDSDSPDAVLSFMIQDIGTDPTNVQKLEQYRLYNNSKIIQSLDSTNGWTLNLNQLGQRLMGKASASQFLNFYTYPGTLTYSPCSQVTWYIYGTELLAPTDIITSFTNLFNTATTFTPGTAPNFNSRSLSGAGGGSSNQPAQKLCFTGYFSVTIGHTYGLWFGVAIIVLFFIATLWLGEKPVKDPRYQENVWTIHPFYSLYFFGNDLHTRKSRAALILVMMSLNAMFSSLWYNHTQNRNQATNTIVFGVYSALISFFVVFFVGNILRWYYVAKHQFLLTNEEAWDQKAQNRIFAYYFIVFIIVVTAWPVTVWMLNDLDAESDVTASKLWIASFFIGLALEMLIFYPLACLLASKSDMFKNLSKTRGFMYDNICHETYLAYAKKH